MSCLYSSPELNHPIVSLFETGGQPGAFRASESTPFRSAPISSTVFFNKDAFPTRRRHRQRTFRSACQNKPCFLA
jgi:hypothetical protein